MRMMFWDAKLFKGNLISWDVSNVEDMRDMFNSAISFNSDISSWDVSGVKSVEYMFVDAHGFNQNLCRWWDKNNFDWIPTVDMFLFSGCDNTKDISKYTMCKSCEEELSS